MQRWRRLPPPLFFLMIRRPPRSTQGVSSAASDVYKRQEIDFLNDIDHMVKKFVIGKEYEGVFLKPRYGDASGVRGAARLGRSATY